MVAEAVLAMPPIVPSSFWMKKKFTVAPDENAPDWSRPPAAGPAVAISMACDETGDAIAIFDVDGLTKRT